MSSWKGWGKNKTSQICGVGRRRFIAETLYIGRRAEKSGDNDGEDVEWVFKKIDGRFMAVREDLEITDTASLAKETVLTSTRTRLRRRKILRYLRRGVMLILRWLATNSSEEARESEAMVMWQGQSLRSRQYNSSKDDPKETPPAKKRDLKRKSPLPSRCELNHQSICTMVARGFWKRSLLLKVMISPLKNSSTANPCPVGTLATSKMEDEGNFLFVDYGCSYVNFGWLLQWMTTNTSDAQLQSVMGSWGPS